jgi:hypothetical protein
VKKAPERLEAKIMKCKDPVVGLGFANQTEHRWFGGRM